MIRSMTGFAGAEAQHDFGRLAWELRSVNHRYLEIGTRLPEDFRAIEGGGDELILRAYDPTFYTAYDLTGGVHTPEGCDVRIDRPDLDAAYAAVDAALKDMPPDPDDYPEVGDLFADTVRVTCE